MSSCSEDSADERITLSSEEQEVLGLVSEDVTEITDKEYADIMTEILYHTDEYKGKLFTVEGIYSSVGSEPRLYRTLVNGGEKTECGIVLTYLNKEIDDGAWIRVTGIVNESHTDGEKVSVLEVIAAETLAKSGKAELKWSGSTHEH